MIDEVLRRRVEEFCWVLRANGFRIGLSETVDCLEALKHIDVFDKEEFRQALMCTLVKRADQVGLFFYLFEIHFSGTAKPTVPFTRNEEVAVGGQALGVAAAQTHAIASLAKTYSPLHVELEKKPSASLEHRWAIKRNLKRIVRVNQTLGGRRRRRSSKGRVDLKATVKQLLRSGEIKDLKRSEKKPAKSRLVVLVDVSGSMDHLEERLFEFMYVASNTNHNSSVFCFSSSLRRVDGFLRGKSVSTAAETLGSRVGFWGSGTRIGECFVKLLREQNRLLDKKTALVVVSDGWDLGDIEALRSAAARLRERVGAVVWLNPLADTEGYRPISSGMAALLPYIDVFGGLNPVYESGGIKRIIRASGGV